MFCSCRISTDKHVALSLCHSRASCLEGHACTAMSLLLFCMIRSQCRRRYNTSPPRVPQRNYTGPEKRWEMPQYVLYFLSYRLGINKVSNSKSDLQAHSRSLVFVTFNGPYTISSKVSCFCPVCTNHPACNPLAVTVTHGLGRVGSRTLYIHTQVSVTNAWFGDVFKIDGAIPFRIVRYKNKTTSSWEECTVKIFIIVFLWNMFIIVISAFFEDCNCTICVLAI